MISDKQITLLASGIIVISLFFLLPRNQSWMRNRVVAYWKDLPQEASHLDLEYRKSIRYGNSYLYSNLVADFFRQKKIEKNVLVLVPPASYFKKYGLNYDVPEPAVFYYFTGIKTVWPSSSNASEAGWFVHMKSGRLAVDSVITPQALLDSIAIFKKFPSPL